MDSRELSAVVERMECLLESTMSKAGRLVPARLQSALALLERLRELPLLQLSDHLAGSGSSGLKSHERFGKDALRRIGLTTVVKVYGRRSSNLQAWGQPLLDILKDGGFNDLSDAERSRFIDAAQGAVAASLRRFHDDEPLLVAIRSTTAEHVIKDVLNQADAKGKSGEVAQYLVGAKLALRFPVGIPLHAMNRPDRASRHDQEARSGDFELGNAVIEVAIGLPDEKHLEQIREALEHREREVWLLTRASRVEHWKREIDVRFPDRRDAARIAVTSVEAFVGQNISELGEFYNNKKAEQLRLLFELYNSRLDQDIATPGIRIETKS